MPNKTKAPSRRRCHCRLCKQGRMIKRTIANGSRQQIRRAFDDLGWELEAEATGHQYYQAIFDGAWPNSANILRQALARVEAKEAANKALRNLVKTVDFAIKAPDESKG